MLFVAIAAPAAAQERPPQTPGGWTFSWDASVFAGWNYQNRKFTDFQRFESQNWITGNARRPIGLGRLRVGLVLSLEPLTIQPLGSPQADERNQ